jgi:hypothetical protein
MIMRTDALSLPFHAAAPRDGAKPGKAAAPRRRIRPLLAVFLAALGLLSGSVAGLLLAFGTGLLELC